MEINPNIFGYSLILLILIIILVLREETPKKKKKKKIKKTNEFQEFNKTLKNFVYYNPYSIQLRNGLGITELDRKKNDFVKYVINIITEDFVVVYTHQIRGSLIEVAYRKNFPAEIKYTTYIDIPKQFVIIEYVDQSKQYNGSLGLNNVTINIDDSEIIKLREQLEGYIQSLEKQNRKDQDGEK